MKTYDMIETPDGWQVSETIRNTLAVFTFRSHAQRYVDGLAGNGEAPEAAPSTDTRLERAIRLYEDGTPLREAARKAGIEKWQTVLAAIGRRKYQNMSPEARSAARRNGRAA